MRAQPGGIRRGVRRAVAALIATGVLGVVRPSPPASALPPAPVLAVGPRLGVDAAQALATGEVVQGPRPRLLGVPHVSGRERVGYVAFTFDDGPHRDTTPHVLAALAAHGVPGAFFVCGYMIDGDTAGERANARVLEDIVAAGHLVGNHTFLHTRLEGATPAEAWDAVARNEAVLAGRLGRPTRLFRPPYGKLPAAAERLLLDQGYTIVRWSIDPKDYTARPPKELAAEILADILARGGGVVVLHDVKPWSAKALPILLTGLERENCRRLAKGQSPILPVSLDYFAVDAAGRPLPVPPEVEARTQATRAALERRCGIEPSSTPATTPTDAADDRARQPD